MAYIHTPPARESALTDELHQLVDLFATFGIIVTGEPGAWYAHNHDPDGTCLIASTRRGPFRSIAHAIKGDLSEQMVDLDDYDATLDLWDAVSTAGLDVYAAHTDDDDVPVAGTTWGYRWVCGCTGDGFGTEAEALAAALTHHQPPDHSPTRHDYAIAVLTA